MGDSNSILRQLMLSLKKGKLKTTTEKEKRRAAGRQVSAAYDAKRLAAQQQYDSEDAAYARELQQLGERYRAQREQSEADYAAAYAARDRDALSKGMQRSSYNGQTLAGISLAGAKALQAIADEEGRESGSISDQRTLAARQLAQTMNQYAQSEQSDIQAYMDRLRADEREQQQQALQNTRELLGQLYTFRREREKDDLAQRNWQALFRAKYGSL